MEILCNCGQRRFEVPAGENVHCPRCGRAYTGVELMDESSAHPVKGPRRGTFTPVVDLRVKLGDFTPGPKKPKKKGKIITQKGRLSSEKGKIFKKRKKK